MAYISSQLSQFFAEQFFGLGPWWPVTGIFVRLWTGNPGRHGTGGWEIEAPSYLMQLVEPPQWGILTTSVYNNAEINFPEAEEAWGVVTHVVLQAETRGTLYHWFYDELEDAVFVEKGHQPSFAATDLTIIFS